MSKFVDAVGGNGCKATTEVVEGGRAIWQSETAKTYRCPVCLRPIFTQHEGDGLPEIICKGTSHSLTWVV